MRQIIPALVCGCLLFFAGCTDKAKLQRHIKRADVYFEKGEHEKARIEYLNAFNLKNDDAYVAARLAECFLKDGEIVRAYRLFSHSIAVQPTNNEVRAKLATLLLLAGEPAKAREQAQEILKSSPLHSDALLLFANASIRSNEIAEARALFETLAVSAPTNSSVFLGFGTVAQRAGAPELAEKSLLRAVQLHPESAKNNLVLGTFYFMRGETNKAESYLKAAMNLSPAKSVERLGFAEFLLKTDRREEAEETLKMATAKHPDFLPGWNLLVRIAFAQNNTNKAGDYIAKALAIEPNNREALLNQVQLKIAASDFKSAATQLEQLVSSHPRDSEFHYQLGFAQLFAGEPLKALTSLDKAIASNTNNVDAILLRSRLQISRGEVDNSITDLTQVIRRMPFVAEAYYLLASALTTRGSVDEAIALYGLIAKKFPKDSQAYQRLGALYYQKNNYQESRRAFEQALIVNPDNLAAIEGLIELDIVSKQHSAALARIQGYVERFPTNPLPLLLKAKVLFDQEKNHDAEAAVKQAIALDPEFGPGHRAMADFYVRTKQTDKAISQLESQLKRHSGNLGALIQLGMLYESKAEYSQARENYEAALKVNPLSVQALNNLAYLLSERMGNANGAVQYARKARQLAPQDPVAADTFGWILWRKGDYAEALTALQQAAERLPDRPEVQYHLGMAYASLNQTPLAMAALTKAIQSTKDFVGKNNARNALVVLQVDPAKAAPEQIELIQQHLTANPYDIFAHVKLARIYLSRSDWNKARETYEKALSTNSKSPLILSSLAALLAGPLNEPNRALDLAKQAWAISPDSSIAELIGPVAYIAGDYKWANGRLLEVTHSQSPAELLYYKGLTSYALGNVSQSRVHLIGALEDSALGHEKATLAKATIAILGFQSGEVAMDEAQRAINAVRSLDPLFPPAEVAAGLIAEQKKDYSLARRIYEKALQNRPGLLVVQRQLAVLLGEKLADDPKAYQLATQLRAEFPGDMAIAKVLGKIAYRRGDYRESVRLLTSASSKQSDDSDLLYYLGMSQYHLKDKSAKASLTKAIALEPDAPLSADARMAVSELKYD